MCLKGLANVDDYLQEVRGEILITHFFNLTIGSHLLYKFERLQYAELLKRHTDKRICITHSQSVKQYYYLLDDKVSNKIYCGS
ncbi:unnamed protein product [Trichobilharzia regenti]|nr:unnamed protein product [Trichobilharzia regenti]